MPYDRILDHYSECIDIEWTDPILINDLSHDYEKQGFAYLYKILACWGKHFSLLYIGKTFAQIPSKRLKNADHKAKRSVLEEKYPHHKLMVSFGIIHSKITQTKLSDIENLLIYAHSTNNFKRLINKRNTNRHQVIKNYCLSNYGFKDDGMYSEVALAVFFRR